jgi:hypothetical protein
VRKNTKIGDSNTKKEPTDSTDYADGSPQNTQKTQKKKRKAAKDTFKIIHR